MKQNLIFPIEFDHFTGGMIHSVVSLIEKLSENFNVYIIAHQNAEILTLNLNATPLILKEPWSISIKSPIKTLKTYLEVKSLLKPFDTTSTLVFTNNVGSELIFSGFGFFPIKFKRVFVSRGGDYLGKTGYFLRKGFKSVFRFIAISQRQINVLLNNNVLKSNISYITNGVQVSGSDNFKYQFKKNNKIVISVIGYLMPEKNQELAIKALKILRTKYPNIYLKLYGVDVTNNVYTTKLSNYVSLYKLQEAVEFCGFESNKYKIFSSIDILVSTSLSEGFGRTVAEAMSFGIPCIGLEESGGINEIISNGINGVIINNNPYELSNALVQIIENKSFRETISRNAITSFQKNFTEDIMCRNYFEFIKKIFNT